ncbi:hypothetical protein HELRODRAFT_182698 [Helobdella robusta]|uniref:Cadherin domain-containing protein n=1 Tax=Helobdella robusta TaxID=6412 RepID=T1FIL4_HELRO|nr:hypothetical protein HELRODRAFT_182698 [Helobdella robusta]ESN90201.1 hypothetical protein HELRODRAFT_182698 [Helobdella robusta]
MQPLRFFHIIKVIFVILDLNDNKPFFTKSLFQTSVLENTNIGFRIALPTAIDTDSPENGIIGYTLHDCDHTDAQYFKLVYNITKQNLSTLSKNFHPNKNYLDLEITGLLDRELKSLHTFAVEAWDDENLFRKKQRHIKLKSPNDNHCTIPSLFIKINVDDVNDNKPIFLEKFYKVDVYENIPGGSSLVTVRATDEDIDKNGLIAYSLSEKTIFHYLNMFSINSKTGEIILIKKSDDELVLDYEVQNQYTLEIVASDHGNVSLSEKTHVLIKVLDVNDNPPKIHLDPNILEASGCCWWVEENKNKNTIVATVSVFDPDSDGEGAIECFLQTFNYTLFQLHANDIDEGINAEIRYRLKKKRDSDVFHVDSKSGNVWSVTQLNREYQSIHELKVIAEDQGRIIQKFSAVKVFVIVEDVNDEKPQFSEKSYFINVLENVTAGNIIGQIEAIDKDLPPYDECIYNVEPYNSHLMKFKIFTNISNLAKNAIKKKEDYEDFDRKRQNYLLKDTNSSKIIVNVLQTVIDIGFQISI